MAEAPFPFDPVLTGIAMAYRNPRMIADEVLPRLPPFDREEFKYYLWTKAEPFTIPDTKVGRRSQPNEVEFSGAELTGTTKDYGLDDIVPYTDQQNARGSGQDPLARATEGLTDLVGLDREARVAGQVFNASNYPAANKATLSGTDQWTNGASDPIDKISTALDVPLMRPNTMILGQEAWTALRKNGKIISAVNVSGATSGMASRQAVQDLFEIENLLVGQSFYNTAKAGQTPAMARLWGKFCSLLYLDPLALSTSSRITFGFTAQFGTKVSGSMPEPKVGLRGGTRVRVGESVAEVISANDLGYLFSTVIP